MLLSIWIERGNGSSDFNQHKWYVNVQWYHRPILIVIFNIFELKIGENFFNFNYDFKATCGHAPKKYWLRNVYVKCTLAYFYKIWTNHTSSPIPENPAQVTHLIVLFLLQAVTWEKARHAHYFLYALLHYCLFRDLYKLKIAFIKLKIFLNRALMVSELFLYIKVSRREALYVY